MAAGKADEAAGLAPSNEENEAGDYFSPEKPCLPLSIDGLPYHVTGSLSMCSSTKRLFVQFGADTPASTLILPFVGWYAVRAVLQDTG